ncbi:MAG: hypothetical protein WKF75_15705 [Singulisphaera sp.]
MGRDFIAARSYTVEEDRAILKQFRGARGGRLRRAGRRGPPGRRPGGPRDRPL